jgi:hypothetical protein
MVQSPVVDGALSEWGGSLTYLDDEPVAMSVVPTDSLLYVALATQDRELIRSVTKRGLVVWVDPAGGEARTYGVQYPLGLRAQRAGQTGPGSPAPGASDPQRGPGAASLLDQLALDELDVIRHDSTRVRIPAQFSAGLRAQATIDPGALVYELAIPLGTTRGTTDKSQRHGLRASLGSTVSVGLQTPESDQEVDLDVPDQGGAPSVTGTRGRTRRGRRPPRRRQPRRIQGPELPTLDVWTRVTTTGM